MHDRYQVRHDFLTPELGDEIVSISRLVNAFFRWEFNSCETIVKDGVAYPIDYANASPDVALTSLHYYFPWAIKALVRWSRVLRGHAPRDARQPELARLLRAGATATTSPTRRSSRSTASSPTTYFQVDAYEEFCDDAPRRTSTRSRTSGSRRPSSTTCSSRPCARRSRRTSTSTSSRTTAGCSRPGHDDDRAAV